tara:strand:- start:1602 stop:2384 length:783 start_codon:yes stop_codon:yes gene_type:complete
VGGFAINRINNKRVVVVIQARMDSYRLPGKVLKKVLNKPLLGYLVDRLRRATLIDDIVVATTINKSDDLVVEYCEINRINYFRGSETDVLSRYYMASRKFNADFVIRICGDSPLIDPLLVDEMVQEYFKKKPIPDYFSNTINQSFPLGMNIEIFSLSALKLAFINAKKFSEREHVTPYIYMNTQEFNISQKHIIPNLNQLRLTVDQKEDFEVIKLVIENFNNKNQVLDFSLEDIINLSKEKPEIFSINAKVAQVKIEDLM